MKGRISKEDKELLLRISEDTWDDVLLKAEELGYVVDRELIIEMAASGIDTRMLQKGYYKIEFDTKYKTVKTGTIVNAIKNKVYELFGDDPYDLVVAGHIYSKNIKKRYKRKIQNNDRRTINCTECMFKIIRGTELSKCTSIWQINNFKLGEKDEEIRRGLQLSSENGK